MTEQLRVRPKGDLQSPNELWGCPQRVPFRGICRNRKRCSADLVDKGEVLGEACIEGERIALESEILGNVPGVELVEFSHTLMFTETAAVAIMNSPQDGSIITHPASRISHPGWRS